MSRAVEFAPGALVRARGRDWVVLPPEEPDVLRLRPLTGGTDEVTGLYLPLEGHRVTSTRFEPPDPANPGDAVAGLLLADAARLSLRSGAAPFRSLGQISVRPRPYQFVPLIMALRLDPVRLLIADDVGVGKTIEAALIARELLDRGIVRRIAVVCPAHLCDQWEAELRDKFAIEAKVIQPSRIARLERELPRLDLSIYRFYPHLIVSIDFIKSDLRRQPFLDNAPDLVIVDEAHIAARPRGDFGAAQQQRYRFIRELAADPSRHVILVTATPHSGIEESFRSLLGLLDSSFDVEPAGAGADVDRRELLPHVVQRRRADLARWLGTETPFPERVAEERTYQLSPAYRALFNDVRAYFRETVRGAAGLRAQQRRVRYWAAIAMLRSVLSSPSAAAAVLSGRAKREGLAEDLFASEDAVDDTYRPQVLDVVDAETTADWAPSAPVEDVAAQLPDSERRRLRGFLRRALDLAGAEDRKLAAAANIVGGLLAEGYRPIVFCRFIQTAKYLEHHLPRLLAARHPGLHVKAVTGEVGDDERRVTVDELVRDPVRVLVATDCLSEGVNLQQHFDAVVHYDLPWNPNRLEQREGRVDRFGQTRQQVKAVLLYGADNEIDQVVRRVLIEKARAIRRQLGVAVPVPAEGEQVVEAVVNTVLLQQPDDAQQLQLALDDPRVSRLHAEWDAAAQRQGAEGAYFRQRGIQPDEVQRELELADPVLCDPETVQRFMADVAQRLNGDLRLTRADGVFDLDPGDLRTSLADCGWKEFPLRVVFDGVVEDAVTLGRTHPVVATAAEAVLSRALALTPDLNFRRSGAIYTTAVSLRTGVVLLRLRYLLKERARDATTDGFAEEVLLAAFERRDGRLQWLEPFESAGRDLLDRARAVQPMPTDERTRQVSWALDLLGSEPNWYAPVVGARVEQLQESHRRLRRLARQTPLAVQPHTPPDVLGCYVLVPTGGR